jgi:hypothetical protein
LISGMIGELVSRVYILENNFNIPLFGEIDISRTMNGESNLVIRGAKNVIVQQDAKIFDAAQAVRTGIVGIFAKLATTTSVASATKNGAAETSGKFDAGDYYQFDAELAQGFIITSDGWIISDFTPPELQVAAGLSAPAAEKNNSAVMKKYVVIMQDRKIYQVDGIIHDKSSGYSFWHINAIDLPVKRFMEGGEISNGQMIVAENRNGWVWPIAISGIKADNDKAGMVRSSDLYFQEMILESAPADEFRGSCLFNLNGDLAGFIGQDGKARPVDNFMPAINGLLKNKRMGRPELGVNYIDLSEFIQADENGTVAANGALVTKNPAGVAVAKGGAADLACLKEGDIIVTVDNKDIDAGNDLRKIINGYIAGDEISIVYMRKGERKEVKMKLQEIK